MRDSGGSLAQNCWQGDLGLTAVGQDDTGGGGIPGDHLIVPVSGHSVPSPMHLRLGQKEKVWTREYPDEEDEDGMGGIEAIGDEEEENNLDGEDKGEFEEDSLSQAEAGDLFRSHLSRYRALRRFRRWQRLRSHGGLRLTQHWKSWRQRAQRVCFLGQRWSRRAQSYNLYGKQRRIKRYQQSPYMDGEDDSNNERSTESDRDEQINGCSPDKQEDRGRREAEVKRVELALTEEHMSCVTGMDHRLSTVTVVSQINLFHILQDFVKPLSQL
ncbi:putative sentrin-specific protease 5-like [Scophthalmus maximus]|uniref:Putative sentrin-specific protease 5-like n=1 Tax=Scophthalmus maximus TaxID=52904 RepID=A0A2U9AW00_SCOMX|nr:putative sentrin-specific protease 5-like [Scophthalmus maximus]